MKFLRTWVGEWWVTAPWSESPSLVRNNDEEEPGDLEDNETLLGPPRNWVKNWKGLTMVPKKTKQKILEKGLHDFLAEEGEEEEYESSSRRRRLFT